MQALFKNLFLFDHADSIGVKLYLLIFEVFIACYTIIYAWEWGMYILQIREIILPTGLANYINVTMFLGNDLALINAVIISLLTIWAFFSEKYKWFYTIIFILLHLQYVTRFSLGKIPHSSNFIGFGLLGLGLAFCFFKDKWKALAFAYGFLLFFVGLGYTSAAVSKLLGTGINWADGKHLWLWIAEKSTDVLSAEGRFALTWLQELALKNRTIATLLLTGGLLTEATAFLMWWKKPRPFIAFMIIGMHIGIYYSMNIFFMSYIIGLSIIGFPWYLLINYIDKKYEWKGRETLMKTILNR